MKLWFAPKRLILMLAVILCCGIAVAYFSREPDDPDPKPKGKSEKKDKRSNKKDDDGVREDWIEMQRALDPTGDGFLTWTSNRTGVFRVWRCELDGTGERMISPEEDGHAHLAAHISPDGRRIAFVSVPGNGAFSRGAVYSLRVMDADGKAMKELVPGVCLALGGFRSVVWTSPGELIYIDDQKRAVRLNIDSGEKTVLTSGGHYMVNRQLTHAFDRYYFHRYDAGRSEVVRSGQKLGGCGGYFSHDGRWGIRMTGAGGPITRVDLATGDLVNLIEDDDIRMPTSRNYMYFPMISRCNRVLAFGASRNKHDASTSDYDIFVVRTDPETLIPEGKPVRYTFDPGTDRYPDVYLAELPLGRYSVEAPATVDFVASGSGAGGRWNYGGGSEVSPGIARFDQPGVFEIEREMAGKVERGKVTVREKKAPAPVSVSLRGSRTLEVVFDEKVDASSALAKSASGIGSERVESSGCGRIVEFELDQDFTLAEDEFTFSGVVDLAEEPNTMQPATLTVARPAWPADISGATFVWEKDGGAKQAPGAAGAGSVECSAAVRGRAQLDRNGAMVVRGGSFLADAESSARTLAQIKTSGAFSLEAVIEPAEADAGELKPIITFSPDGTAKDGNFFLAQEGEHLVVQVRDHGSTQLRQDLGKLTAGKPQHVVVTYAENSAVCYLNGEKILDTSHVAAGLRDWVDAELTFGSGTQEQSGWAGKIDGVSIYARALGSDQVASDYKSASGRWENKREDRVQSAEVELELSTLSTMPTLSEIKPYNEGLVVCEFKVNRVVGELEGVVDGGRVRAVLWAILDNRLQPITSAKPGDSLTLRLEPFDAQPQLKTLFKKDTLPFSPIPLMFDTGEAGSLVPLP